jgi:Na+/H+ antiporter NhaC
VPAYVVEGPRVALTGVALEARVRASEPERLPAEGVELRVALLRDRARPEGVIATIRLFPSEPEATVSIEPEGRGGRYELLLLPAGPSASFDPLAASARFRVLPGLLSLGPPLLAIGLALWLRQVIPALFAGVWFGAFLAGGLNPFTSFLRTFDRYVVGQLADADHVKIIVFTLLLGGMVGLVTRAGGAHGIVAALRSLATSSRRGQLSTWAMGLLVFFDDYANTLIVGNTMRPLTDRLRISREKLAYIVDSTAAPVATFALVSTWIGFEVGLIGDALKELGLDTDPYGVFLRSIPHLFYPILALVFVALVAGTGRDFGPMAAAERRAAEGRLLRRGAAPLADWSARAVDPPEDIPRRAVNALLPIALVIAATFVGLWVTGRQALAATGAAEGTLPFWRVATDLRAVGTVFGQGSSFDALLWAAAGGCLLALLLGRAQGLFRLPEALQAWFEGVKAMLLAFVILTLAWCVGEVCRDLQTADYLVQLVSGVLAPRLLPLVIFLVASGVSFATGSSWSTMGILIPLAVPLAHHLGVEAGLPAGEPHVVLVGSVAAVLAGAIFGDHCSPISDTTVMSSMASACDHVDHVRTQLPYALAVAGVAMLVGIFPASMGIPAWLGLLVGVAVLWGILRTLGRRNTALQPPS